MPGKQGAFDPKVCVIRKLLLLLSLKCLCISTLKSVLETIY